MNLQEKVLIEPIYENLYSLYSDFVYIVDFKNDIYKYKLADKYGKIITPEYDEIGHLSEGMIYVQKNGKFGFVNTKGELVVPLIYDGVNDFAEGFAPVLLNGVS